MNGGPLTSRVSSEHRLWELLALLPVWLVIVPVLFLVAAIYGMWVVVPAALLVLLTCSVVMAAKTVTIRFDGDSFLVWVGVKRYSIAVGEIERVQIVPSAALDGDHPGGAGRVVDHRVHTKAKSLLVHVAGGHRYAFSVTDGFADQLQSHSGSRLNLQVQGREEHGAEAQPSGLRG